MVMHKIAWMDAISSSYVVPPIICPPIDKGDRLLSMKFEVVDFVDVRVSDLSFLKGGIFLGSSVIVDF